MKKILLGVGVVIICALLFFFFTREKAVVIDAMALPVITGEGPITLQKETINRPLLSPESVEAPFTLVTGEGAWATVTFPDGSELRAHENSTLTVDEAMYAKADGELRVGVTLSVGRVWSNIIALVTPASRWEVETSNVVATVRGTAFGVEATVGTTTIIGSEHTVELTLIDPETGERDETRKQPLLEDEFIVIGNSVATDETTAFPAPKKRSERTENDTWIKENETLDGNNTEESDSTDTALEEVAESDPKDVVEDLKEETLEEMTQDSVVNTTAPQTTTPAPQTSSASSGTVRPISLTITPSVALGGIVEETKVTLTGTLTLSDGTKRDVSKEVAFRVIGNVGSVQGGIFTPLLDASVSEFGRAYGSISGTWKDSVTGATLEGTTDIFEVKPKITVGIQEG